MNDLLKNNAKLKRVILIVLVILPIIIITGLVIAIYVGGH